MMIGSMKRPSSEQPNEEPQQRVTTHATYTLRSLPLMSETNMQQVFKEEFNRYSPKSFKYTFGTHTVEVEGSEYLVNWAEYLVKQEFNNKSKNLAAKKLNEMLSLDEECSRKTIIQESQ